METESLATRARSYIAALDLPPAPPRSRAPGVAPPDPAAVGALAVGQNLVEFAPGVPPALRAAAADALLLAQLAADKAGAASPDQWYDKHREVLSHLGFRSDGLTRTAQDFSSTDAELHEAILPVITAAFGGAAIPALVIETLRQLSEASAGAPWITVFERESRRFDARQFQISLVDGTETEQSVTMLGFALGVAHATTQVLFFRHARDTVAVERVEGRFSTSSGTLAALAPDIAARLADRRRDYLAALEI
jgi:hypothetical protein